MQDFKSTLWGRDRPTIANPTTEQISEYISTMYPHDWDRVLLYASNDADDSRGRIMARSVENDDDKVVVFCEPMRRNEEFRHLRLIDPTIQDGEEAIYIIIHNGQKDDHPKREGVSKENAIIAFLDFLKTGEPSTRLTWWFFDGIIQPTER